MNKLTQKNLEMNDQIMDIDVFLDYMTSNEQIMHIMENSNAVQNIFLELSKRVFTLKNLIQDTDQ